MYSREIDGTVLTLSASGWTYESLFVLYDYETESIWYDLTDGQGLTCVAGPYEDRKLPKKHAYIGTWKNWKLANPTTLALRQPLGPR